MKALTIQPLHNMKSQNILHSTDCLDSVRYMYETIHAAQPSAAAEDTQKLYFDLLAERNRQNEVFNNFNERITALYDVWQQTHAYKAKQCTVKTVEQAINDYEACKPKEEPFHPVKIYQNIVQKHVPTQEQHAIVTWYRTAPHALLKEALNRVASDHPQKPFGLLKHLMEKWIKAGYQTLEDIQRDDEEYKAKRPTKQRQKASEKNECIRRDFEEKGHHKGIPCIQW